MAGNKTCVRAAFSAAPEGDKPRRRRRDQIATGIARGCNAYGSVAGTAREGRHAAGHKVRIVGRIMPES